MRRVYNGNIHDRVISTKSPETTPGIRRGPRRDRTRWYRFRDSCRTCVRMPRGACNAPTRIAVQADARYIGRWNFLAVQAVPVDLGEPHVRKDIATAAVQVAKALRQIGGEERAQQVLGAGLEEGRIIDIAREDLLIQLDRIVFLRVKGWISSKHLEKQNTHAPPVDTRIVSVSPDDFRSEVVGRAWSQSG